MTQWTQNKVSSFSYVVQTLLTVSLCVSCASRNEFARTPAQASAGVPLVPGMTPDAHSGSTPNNNGNPNNPNPNFGNGAPASGTAQLPQTPGALAQNPQNPQCRVRFDQMPVGGNLSVMALLQRAGFYQDIPNVRLARLDPNFQMDLNIFRSWLYYSDAAFDIQKAAQYSQVYKEAYAAANGQGSALGMRFAAVLVAMIVTAQDPECTKWIRQYAPQLLGQYAQALDQLPFVQAAELARDREGRSLQAEFQKQESAIQGHEKHIQSLERDIERLENERDERAKVLKAKLKRQFRDFALELMDIEACRTEVFKDIRLDDPEAEVSARSEQMLADCESVVRIRAGRYGHQVEALEEKIKSAEKSGSEAELLRLRKQLKEAQSLKDRYYEKLERGSDGGWRLKKPQTWAALKDTLDEVKLFEDGKKSGMQARRNDAGEIVRNPQGQPLMEKTELQKATEQKNQLAQTIESLYPRALTYGYFGALERARAQQLQMWQRYPTQMQLPQLPSYGGNPTYYNRPGTYGQPGYGQPLYR